MSSTLPVDPAPWTLRKTVLAEAGVDGALFQLAPDAEVVETEADAARARVVFVTHGQVTVTQALTNHIISAEETLHLPSGKPVAIAARGVSPAKVLVFTLPAPRLVQAPLVSFA